MLFDNVTIRLLGSDDFPADAKQQAASDLTTAAHDGALSIPIGDPIPLARGRRRPRPGWTLVHAGRVILSMPS